MGVILFELLIGFFVRQLLTDATVRLLLLDGCRVMRYLRRVSLDKRVRHVEYAAEHVLVSQVTSTMWQYGEVYALLAWRLLRFHLTNGLSQSEQVELDCLTLGYRPDRADVKSMECSRPSICL